MKFTPRFILLALLLLAHLVFLFRTFVETPLPLTDSAEYLNASENLLTEGLLYCGELNEHPQQPEKLTRRPPLYPLFLSIGMVTGSVKLIFVIQILISLFTVLLIWRIFVFERTAEERSPQRITLETFLLLVFVLITPAQFIYSSRIMAEIPFQLCLVLSAWSVFSYFRHGEEKQIWLFNLYITLGMAMKPVLFPFAIVTILISLILFIRKRRPVLLLALTIPVLWIFGYSIRNYTQTGSFQYSSIQTANLVNYNLRYFVMSEKGNEAAAETVDRLYETCNPASTYPEKKACLHTEVKEVLRDQPVRYALFHIKGSMRYFLDPGRFDLVSFFNLENSGGTGLLKELNEQGIRGAIRFLRRQGGGLIFLLGLIGLFKLLKITGFLIYVVRAGKDPEFRLFLVLLVGYLAFATGPLGGFPVLFTG